MTGSACSLGQISIGSGTTITLTGSLSASAGINNSGTIIGHGAIRTGTGTFDLEGTGEVIASGGILDFGAVNHASTSALHFTIGKRPRYSSMALSVLVRPSI